MARPARYGGVDLSLPQVYSGLRNAGLPHNQAANLAGVLHAESGGYTGSFYNGSTERPGALNSNGAFGLAQLNGPRQAQLLNFAGSKEAASDPQTQLNFIAKDAQSGRYGNLDLNNVRSIVDKYETPRADLRAGEAAVGSRNAASLSPSSYDPSLGGQSSGPMNTNDPLSYTGPQGFQTAGMSQYYGDAGNGAITSYKANANGSADVVLGDDSGSAGAGQGLSASSFSGANIAGQAGAGSFGLSGFTSDGAGVGGGLGATGAGTNPNGYSLDGATLNSDVSAGTISDPIVGYNAAGPVTANPTLVGATNSVASATAKGTKQIGDDTKTAGETIGKSVTGLGSTLSGISQSWQSLGTDYFTRLVFIVVGLIALAAALLMFKPVQNAVSTVVPAARVARAVRAVKGAAAS